MSYYNSTFQDRQSVFFLMFKHRHLKNSSSTFNSPVQLQILLTHHHSDQEFVLYNNYNFPFSSHLSISRVSTLLGYWKTFTAFSIPIYSLLTLYIELSGVTSVFLLSCCTSTKTVFKLVLYVSYFSLSKKKQTKTKNH